MSKFSMGGFGFSMYEAEPTTLRIDIYDDIGESKDFWTGEIRGFGETKIRELLDASNAHNVEVHINSRGGDVFAGISVYNILRSSGKHVETYVDGIAASAASVIAMAGEIVHMYRTSQLMVHNCYTYACGNSNDFRKLADDMDKVMMSVKYAYIDQGGDLVEEYIQELLDNETYLTAQEALCYGLCDVIDDAAPAETGGGSDNEDTEKSDEETVETSDIDTETDSEIDGENTEHTEKFTQKKNGWFW